jgi:hypothetical protein
VAGALLIVEKIRQRAALPGCWNFSNILLMRRNPKKNCWLSGIFWVRFGGKDRGLCPYKPWSEQAGGWIHFLYEAAQNYEVFSKIQN